jgi:hypothetical protein
MIYSAQNRRVAMRTLYSIAALFSIAFIITGCVRNDGAVQPDGTETPLNITWSVDAAGMPAMTAINGRSLSGGSVDPNTFSPTGFTSSITINRFMSSVTTVPPERSGVANSNQASGFATFAPGSGVTGVSATVGGRTYTFEGRVYPPGFPDSLRNRIPVALIYPYYNGTVPPSFMELGSGSATVAFTVTGNLRLTDNTITVPAAIAISAPRARDTVSRASGFTLRLNGSGVGTNTVAILTVQPPIPTRRDSTFLPIVSSPIIKNIAAGASTVDFSATELQRLGAGNAMLSMASSNVKRVNNGDVFLTAQSSAVIPLVLK